MLLQIFIFVYCGNDDARHRGWEPDHVPGLNHTAPSPTTSPPGQCGGVTREGQDALTMSLIASVLSIVYRFAMTWLEMKRMKMTFKEYVVSLMEMGAGLPLRAIVENAATNVKIHEDLIDSELRSLAAVLEKNTSVETVNHEWPLIWAVQEGYAVLVSVFLAKERMNANQVDQDGRTALSWAAQKGHADIVTLLLGHAKIDVNQVDKDGTTALSWAAQKGHADIVTLLLGHAKIDVNQADKYGNSPLSIAWTKDRVDIVTLLLGHAKIDVNQADKKYRTIAAAQRKYQGKKAPLFAALQAKDEDAAEALLDGGADPNEVDGDGYNALHRAAEKGCRPPLLQRVLARIHDVNTVTNAGWTVLMIAAYWNQLDVVISLLNHPGIDVNVQDCDNWTALHMAAFKNHPAIVSQLLSDDNINANLKDRYNRTPLKLAIRENRPKCVKILQDYGAKKE